MSNYKCLPIELTSLKQWLVCANDKIPHRIDDKGQIFRTSVTSGNYNSFSEARSYALKNKCNIGFVLTKNDPFCCVDFDVKEGITKRELHYFSNIIALAASYSELSLSGKGVHLWLKANIGAGKRFSGIEIYSQERFIICTGHSINNVTFSELNNTIIPIIKQREPFKIKDGALILSKLFSKFKNDSDFQSEKIKLTESEPITSDDVVWQSAIRSSNSEKFIKLCSGHWKNYNFPSQSEADLALMSMFTFYSQSNAQCKRMFRQTKLGERDKAIKNDRYLDLTLQTIRNRQNFETKEQKNGEKLAELLLKDYSNNNINNDKINPQVKSYIKTIDQTKFTESENNKVTTELVKVGGLEWPPGLIGVIANFIYQSSPRPIKEISIVTALGLMAGILGKSYNIEQTGLNLYLILVARSAVGKEAMHSGLGHILQAPCGQILYPFVDFTDYVSGPALTKAVAKWSSFLNVSGEWGRKFQRMAEERTAGPMQQLRTVMTHLYQKSSSASIIGGLGYSDQEKNIASVKSVAYSMIGETTPRTFYDALTPEMMEDGFLSRFNVVEYKGERPYENKNKITTLPKDISDILCKIGAHSVSLLNRNNFVQVSLDVESTDLLNEFNLECDKYIRIAGRDETIRQIWNRAHIKALRVSAILAVSDNHIKPVVNLGHAKWAIYLIKSECFSMLDKFEKGDIGTNDTTRFKKLESILKSYLQGKVPASYRISRKMIEDGIVPRKFLQIRSNQISCFVNYRLGATVALDVTIKSAIDSGYLQELVKDKTVSRYNYHGRCFRVMDITKK